ncbi:hypothetical protein F4778DRAFT_785615 [Xylariomycetidae sp. FL2044]|nr:hypothetical protein F4778DRAFT_785615 [Xylariomycetidae sp. FL2044]
MDEYEFADDDFDTLNANALQELENSAIQFTQAQKRQDLSQELLDYVFEDDDLDDTDVHDELRGTTALPPDKPEPAPAPAPSSSTRVIPQRDQSWHPAPAPAHQFRPQAAIPSTSRQPPYHPVLPSPSQRNPARHGQGPAYSQIRPPLPPPPLPRPAPVPSRYQPSQAPRQQDVPNHELAALQAQILDLRSKLTTKDGEISIVRKRLEKSREDHERELQALKKQSSDQLAKQERAVEAAKAAQHQATTELEFTRSDLREELNRAKRKDGPSTPKRNAAARTWGLADGFEDVEMVGSPSKGQRRRNAGPVASSVAEPPARTGRTPTKGKRKRPAMDSPVMALETHSEDAMILDEDDHDKGPNNITAVQQLVIAPKTTSLDYLKVILNHSAGHDRPLAFEYLAGFALPSKPTESIASTLFQKLAVAGDTSDPMRLPIEFCNQVIHVWDDCKKESCLGPISELVSLVSLTLQLYTVEVAPHIAMSLVPVAMDSIYEVGIPRFNNSRVGEPTDAAFINFRENINTADMLSLLYLTALGCTSSPPVYGDSTPPAVDFWSQVNPYFVLMLLSQKQPAEDFALMLRLLCTSVFPDSVGPINPDKTAEVMATSIIDRVSLHLNERPRWDLDVFQLRIMRNAILQTLAAFARSPFGLAQLARNALVIPRLVMLLSSSIDELYDGEMEYRPPEPDDPEAELHKLVSHAVLLLHNIVTNPISAETVEVAKKLGNVTGGLQMYLLSLTRLNFGEDLVSEETAELAHELLELAVTSEEGEDLGTYFGG